MLQIDIKNKLQSYKASLEAFVERISEDRWILAAVLVGSLDEDTILRKENIYLWIIEADGVTLRKKSDGEDHRIWRTMVEHDIIIWAEVIPRSRFKRMVEGASRTAFSYNFFAKRELVYSTDEGIRKWFREANTLAQKERNNELLVSTVWVIHELLYARKLLEVRKDFERAWEAALGAAHALAGVHVVQTGEICETPTIYRALELNPDLFATAYTDLLTSGPVESTIQAALDAGDAWLEAHGEVHMAPILAYLKNQPRVVGLSELSNHFAYSQIYPWHLESACEWMAKKEVLEKLAAEMPLTKKSRVQLEEPAYLYHGG